MLKRNPPHFSYKRYLNYQYRDIQATTNHSAANGSVQTIDVRISVKDATVAQNPGEAWHENYAPSYYKDV